MSQIIYDFGANNGDDIPYYLMKSDLVIAVEAIPALCQLIEERFHLEIQSGRLVIENCVLTVDNELSEVPFYVHKVQNGLSQFPKPPHHEEENFERVILPSKPVISLIKKYGAPHYIKIDLENYDQQILQALFKQEIRPPFISVEAHSIEVFAFLISLGRYNAFKVVDGPTISEVYSNRQILTNKGNKVRYSFPWHSSGPYGNDIDGKWMDKYNLMTKLALEGFGWKDIHATNQVDPDPSAWSWYSKRGWFLRTAQKRIKNLITSPFQRHR